jgi:hypothetical protein
MVGQLPPVSPTSRSGFVHAGRHADRRDYARLSAFSMLSNAEAIAEVVIRPCNRCRPEVRLGESG